MKILIAPDSFKGSLSAQEAAQTICRGLERVWPNADYELVPMADGGEGTVAALTAASKGKIRHAQVHGPLTHQEVKAAYGILGGQKTAVIEMSQASGIGYTDEENRDPLTATTYGTGQLIKAALDQGVREIIIGLGGSATNDGGAGMAQALGARLLDGEGKDLPFGGAALADLDRIDLSNMDPRLEETEFLLASDVQNPLTGPQGASAVFGPQKGATPAMVDQLDASLHHFAQIVKRDCGRDLEQHPGAGAAGGLGFGLLAFTNAKLVSGVDLVIEYTRLKERSQGADLVFTGEGSIDFQTKMGKTPYGVAKTAKAAAPHAPVIVLAGNIGKRVEDLYTSLGQAPAEKSGGQKAGQTVGSQKAGQNANQEAGLIDAIFATPSGAKTLAQAIASCRHDIAQTAENIARLLTASGFGA